VATTNRRPDRGVAGEQQARAGKAPFSAEHSDPECLKAFGRIVRCKPDDSPDAVADRGKIDPRGGTVDAEPGATASNVGAPRRRQQRL
jgi:hypothetical protein